VATSWPPQLGRSPKQEEEEGEEEKNREGQRGERDRATRGSSKAVKHNGEVTRPRQNGSNGMSAASSSAVGNYGGERSHEAGYLSDGASSHSSRRSSLDQNPVSILPPRAQSSSFSWAPGKMPQGGSNKRVPKSKLQVITQKQTELKETLTVLANSNVDHKKDEEALKKWNEVVKEKDRLLREQLEKSQKNERRADRDSCVVM